MNIDETQARELDYTYQVLNYAKAIYQGRFAMLNVFKQLGHPLFKPTELEKTRTIIEEVNGWLEEALAKRLIFSFSSATPEKIKVINLLKSIRPELESLAKKTKAILVSDSHTSNNADALFLLAAYTNNIYFQDNYLQTISKIVKIDAANNGNGAELPRSLSDAIATVVGYIEQLSALITEALSNENQVDRRYFSRIKFNCRNLAGNLKSLKADLDQITLEPNQIFDYKQAGFIQAESESWISAGFDLVTACYWRAHDFSIDDTKLWIAAGIANAPTAAEWSTAGFSPEQALGWIKVLFPPILAIQWANAGFIPIQAAILLNAGFSLPEMIPPDQVNDILASEVQKINNMSQKNAA